MMSENVLVISSTGGHWVQLMRLKSLFLRLDNVTYCSTEATYDINLYSHIEKYRYIPDCNRGNIFQIMHTFIKALLLLFRLKPKIVISTGALPGLIVVILAKTIFKSKTIWIDSIANAEEMSLSGQLAKRFSGLWLTQWKHIEAEEGPRFLGSVI